MKLENSTILHEASKPGWSLLTYDQERHISHNANETHATRTDESKRGYNTEAGSQYTRKT